VNDQLNRNDDGCSLDGYFIFVAKSFVEEVHDSAAGCEALGVAGGDSLKFRQEEGALP
jgi:hypothetical protein